MLLILQMIEYSTGQQYTNLSKFIKVKIIPFKNYILKMIKFTHILQTLHYYMCLVLSTFFW